VYTETTLLDGNRAIGLRGVLKCTARRTGSRYRHYVTARDKSRCFRTRSSSVLITTRLLRIVFGCVFLFLFFTSYTSNVVFSALFDFYFFGGMTGDGLDFGRGGTRGGARADGTGAGRRPTPQCQAIGYATNRVHVLGIRSVSVTLGRE